MVNLKKLRFNLGHKLCVISSSLCLIRNLPNLQVLCVALVLPVKTSNHLQSTIEHYLRKKEEAIEHYLESVDWTNVILHQLQFVEIFGEVGSRSVLHLIKLLAASSPSLRDMTLVCRKREHSFEELFMMKQELLRVPRISPQAQIVWRNSLGSEMSIFDPLTQQPVPLQASNRTGLEDPVLSTDSIDDSKLGGDNSSPINLEDVDWISLGLEQLAVDDDALGALIREHKIVAHHETQNMTNFQKVIRSLLELLSIPERKSTVYEDLKQLCHPDIVRPHSVTTTAHQDLIRIGVSSRSNAITISEMGKKFAEAAGDNRNALLSDASLNDVPDEEIYNHLEGVCGLGAYNAYTIMIFGLEKMLDHWPNEAEFMLIISSMSSFDVALRPMRLLLHQSLGCPSGV
ncbi:hypothetical protein ACET3Z_032223 [Daucus carota]